MAKGFKNISCTDTDYAFFKDFARKLSKHLNVDLKVDQALKMAVTQYEVKKGLTK
jgi:hypothetical protein